MNPATAVTFILAGVSLWALQGADARRVIIGQVFAAGVLLIGVLKLCSVAGIFDLGIDQILFSERLFDSGTGLQNRMAPNTAANFVLAGAALLLLKFRPKNETSFPAQYPTILLLVSSFMAVVGYIYGAKYFYLIISFIPMAIHTAAAFLVLAAGVIFSQPEKGILKQVFSPHLGGAAARRLFPVVVFIPLLLGCLALKGERDSLYTIEMGNAMLVIAIIVILGAIIIKSARLLNNAAEKLGQTEEELNEKSELLQLLGKSEESYRQLADAMPQIVWTARPDGFLDYYNQRWFDYTGASRDLKGESDWAPVLHPDDLQNCKNLWERAVETGEAYKVEYRFKRALDGAYRWHLGQALPVRDTENNVVKWFGTGTDIHEQKKVEDDLRQIRVELEGRVQMRTAELERANVDLTGEITARQQLVEELVASKGLLTTFFTHAIAEREANEAALIESAERERAIIENALDVICTMDSDGYFKSINPACLKTLGYQPEEIVGRHYLELVSPECAEETKAAAANVVTGEGLRSFENCYTHKNGTLVHLLWNVHWSESLNLMFGVAHDITKRKQVETDLFRLAAIVESSEDAIISENLDGGITSWNTGAERVFGYTAEEIIGRPISKLYPPEIKGEEKQILGQIVRGDRVEHFETERMHKDGSVIPVSLTASPLKDNTGMIIGLAKIVRDITAQKQAEVELNNARDAALESVRLKSEFLANMSHEIRTPMNGVIGMAELLLATELTARQRDFTETIESSADALLKIIDDILDFSKIEAGQLRFENIDFDLRGAVESTIEILAERAQAKGLEIASLVQSDVPTLLCGDPGRLRQIITNLAGNAVKFTEKGEVTVSVSKVQEKDDSVLLRFEITDTGIGISQREQNRLFQAFVQADGSTTRKYGGTGLGLTISKQLVEMMGGEIGIESEPGMGSTFWFTAHLAKLPDQTPTVAPAGDVSLEGVRVLIVDDNASNRKIFLHQAVSWGMIASEAASGAEALDQMRAAAERDEPFSIALLDLMMPEMDGFELARKIKAEPGIEQIRLVLLPSYGKRGEGQTALDHGISAYLQKPVRQTELYGCLITVLAENKAEKLKGQPETLITRHSLRELSIHQAPVNTARKNVRILIAEDNMVNREVAVSQLDALGYSADIVVNGKEAVEAVGKSGYEIVFMDCQMPVMDGFEATAKIRRFEGESRHCIIIAMTANALEGDREKCLAAGMDDYLSKPVRIDALRAMLERWDPPNVSIPESSESEPDLSADYVNESIDLAVLESFKDFQRPGEPDLVENLISLFVEDTCTNMSALHYAIIEKDESEIKRLAHQIKGSAGNIGAYNMAGICGLLEQNASLADDAKVAIDSLEKDFQTVIKILNSRSDPGKLIKT
ncbi:MAG: PAS domain S-box protein [Pyrinomonadaceae bacterium]